MAEGMPFIESLAICVVSAMAGGIIMKFLRQPALFGYLLAGVVIGPLGLKWITDFHTIEAISEIGLVMLLFMIGLELDLRVLKKSGKVVFGAGLLQFPIQLGAVLAVFAMLAFVSFGGGTHGNYDKFILAAAICMSSTMIIVKLLYDKFELHTLPSRISIGVLVFQDVYAIVLLAILPSLVGKFDIMKLIWSFVAGGLITWGSFLFTRHVLTRLFQKVAKQPEMIVVGALAWCFLIALLAKHAGLSMEMGALIAGVSLATFPYNAEVMARVTGIRDLFLTLYFVTLAMQISEVPTATVWMVSIIVLAVSLLSRALVYVPLLYSFKTGSRMAGITTSNLVPTSEFGLVIAGIALQLGLVSPQLAPVTILTFAATALIGSYTIMYNDKIGKETSRFFRRLKVKDNVEEGKVEEEKSHEVVLLGFYYAASSLLEEIRQTQPDLLPKILVVDYNPQTLEKLARMNVSAHYGDVSNIGTLEHIGMEDAKIVISTIPDHILKNVDNTRLVSIIRRLAPSAKIIVAAESTRKAVRMYEEGAAHVVLERILAARQLLPIIDAFLRGRDLPEVTDQKSQLLSRQEIIDH